MKPKSTYDEPNGEPRMIPLIKGGFTRRVACCDCGLVHKHLYTVKDGAVWEQVTRDDRATAGIRRGMAKRQEIIAEPDSNVFVILRRIVSRKKPRPLAVKYEPC